MRHLDEGTLHALLDGEIPSAELPPIQAHLGACAECRARLTEEQDLLAESDRLIEVLELPEAAPAAATVRTAPRRVWPARLAWAATVVLAAGLGYSIRGGPVAPAPAASPDSGVEFRSAAPQGSVDAPTAEPANQSRETVSEPRRQAAPPPQAGAGSAKTALSNVAPAEEKAEQRVAGVDSAARPPVPPVEQPSARPAAPASVLGRVGGLRQEDARLQEIAPTGALADRAKFAAPQPATLPEAIRVLGGSLRLIDGMIPDRLEILGRTVRVVYRTGFGELLLSQELLNGIVRDTLLAPRDFPADSLERLRRRVRD